jgi:hypothetical protein
MGSTHIVATRLKTAAAASGIGDCDEESPCLQGAVAQIRSEFGFSMGKS